MTDSADEAEYEVERVLAEDVVEGQIFYLVKWQGYSDEECTWEPKESFNSDVTLKLWEKARDLGDVLDDEFLVNLQAKIDAFKARQAALADGETAGDESESDGSSDSEPLKARANSSNSRAISTKAATPSPLAAAQQPRSKPIQHAAPHFSVSSASSLVRPIKRVKMSHKGELPRNKLAMQQETSTGPKKSRLPASQNPDKTSLRRTSILDKRKGKAGQRFRNLSHQYNAQKRARNEPVPDPSNLKLIDPADLETSVPADTGVGLPTSDVIQHHDESFLFIPEEGDDNDSPRHVTSPVTQSYTAQELITQTGTTRNVASNGGISGALTEQMLASSGSGPKDHQIPIRISQGDRANSTANKSDPENRVPHTRGISTSLMAQQTPRPQTHRTTSASSRSADTVSNQKHVSVFKPTVVQPVLNERTMTAANGLTWNKGDIVCDLSMGRPVCKVRLVGEPWHPFGSSLVSLKQGHNLEVHFMEHPWQRTDYDAVFFPSKPSGPASIWNVEPFEHTAQALSEFTDYLESNNVAGIMEHPSMEYYILIYSCESSGWKDIGKRELPTGQARLHASFIRCTRPYPQFILPSAKRRVEANTYVSEPIKTQAPVPSRSVHQRAKLPRLSTETSMRDRSLTNPVSPFEAPNSAVDSLTSPDTPSATHTTLKKQTKSVRRDSSYELQLQDLARSSAIPDLSLRFQNLTEITLSNAKINTEAARFFIAFSKTHAQEAALFHRWLEANTSSNYIMTDSDKNGWAKFKEKANRNLAVILFHEDDAEYTRLEGLGQVLGMQHVLCHSLSFGTYTVNTVTHIGAVPLFPRGSVFLLTEWNMVHQLPQTIAIVRFFMQNKKPDGWQIMFRPRVRAWLSAAAFEATDTTEDRATDKTSRRDTLLDLLVDIQSMIFGPDLDIPDFESINTVFKNDTDDDVDSDDNESLRGDPAGDRPDAFVISPFSIPDYQESGTDDTTIRARDTILIDYFVGFATVNAHLHRRFWVFSKDIRVPNSGHIHYEDPDQFVSRFASRSS